jgi:hypothetical protein
MNTTKRHLITGLSITTLLVPVWDAQAGFNKQQGSASQSANPAPSRSFAQPRSMAPAPKNAQGGITARLEPQSIALGESAQLSVTVNGSQVSEPGVPHVDGLEIVPVGQQSSMQIINGAVSANVTHIYQVTPNRAGSFTIPAITAGGASTQPIAFRVDKGANGQTQRPPSQRHSQLPRASIGVQDNAPVDAKGQSAFLRVVLPKQELTVGELVPVEVKAYFRAGVSASLNGLPVLSSDAFTLNKLGDQPEQTREMIDGVPYTVVTWTSALSAVKAGDYALNLDLPVMVRVKERGQRSRMHSPFGSMFGDDSPFNDPFFDNFFGGMTEKPLTLHTDGAVVKINALPTDGRPADFSGAVGKFDVTSDASAATAATGDPLTLKLTVTGKGNFDRVTTNGLTANADWKSYKPNARFEPADSSNTTGAKTFEQSIVPMKTGAQEIPALRFSYFDPDEQKYVTKTTAPIPVEVAQGAASAPATKSADAAADVPKTNPDGLAADKAVTSSGSASLRPLILKPWFIVLNAVMAAVLAIGAIIRGIRVRRAKDPKRIERVAAKRALNERLAAMDEALDREDAARFFESAREALKEKMAQEWNVPPSRVTIGEIKARLKSDGEEVRSVFEIADEAAYSGKLFAARDLKRWHQFVRSKLQHIALL